MKLLISAILILSLFGCAGHNSDGHMDRQYNPLEGATITTVTPSSTENDMVVIQIELKRIVHAQGIHDKFLYWVINDALAKGNMAVYDITITVNDQRQRFLFGLTDGQVEMVKEIEVDAEVDCQHEGRKYEGREQA